MMEDNKEALAQLIRAQIPDRPKDPGFEFQMWPLPLFLCLQ